MAEQIHIQTRLRYTPANINEVGFDTDWLEIFKTMTGADVQFFTQVIGDAKEAIEIATDIGTQGQFLIINTSTTSGDDVTLGSTTDEAVMLLKPKGWCLFQANAAMYAKAASGKTVKLQIFCFEL